MRISDWSSDVCSSDLNRQEGADGEDQDAQRDAAPVTGERLPTWRGHSPVPPSASVRARRPRDRRHDSSPVIGSTPCSRPPGWLARKRVVGGKSGAVRGYLGGGRSIKTKTTANTRVH